MLQVFNRFYRIANHFIGMLVFYFSELQSISQDYNTFHWIPIYQTGLHGLQLISLECNIFHWISEYCTGLINKGSLVSEALLWSRDDKKLPHLWRIIGGINIVTTVVNQLIMMTMEKCKDLDLFAKLSSNKIHVSCLNWRKLLTNWRQSRGKLSKSLRTLL